MRGEGVGALLGGCEVGAVGPNPEVAKGGGEAQGFAGEAHAFLDQVEAAFAFGDVVKEGEAQFALVGETRVGANGGRQAGEVRWTDQAFDGATPEVANGLAAVTAVFAENRIGEIDAAFACKHGGEAGSLGARGRLEMGAPVKVGALKVGPHAVHQRLGTGRGIDLGPAKVDDAVHAIPSGIEGLAGPPVVGELCGGASPAGGDKRGTLLRARHTGQGGAPTGEDGAAGSVEGLQFYDQGGVELEIVGQEEETKRGEVGRIVQEGAVAVGFLAKHECALLALSGFGGVETGGVRAEQADGGVGRGVGVERFGGGAVGVNRLDVSHGAAVEHATGMELVADGVGPAEGLGAEAFEFEGFERFQAAEVTPHALKAPGHAEPRFTSTPEVAGDAGEVVVAPEAGGERFDFEVGLMFGAGVDAERAVGEEAVFRVVENGGAGVAGADLAGEAFGKLGLGAGLEAGVGKRVLAEEAAWFAPSEGGLAPVGLRVDDQHVDEKTVHRVAREQLVEVGGKVVLVFWVEKVEKTVAAGQGRFVVGGGVELGEVAVAGELHPLGACLGEVFFPADDGVDGSADALGVEGVDEFAEKIASAEGGVGRDDLRRVVAHAVDAFGEDDHAVDVRLAKTAGEIGRIELGEQIGEVGRVVEVQVNLAQAAGERIEGIERGHGGMPIVSKMENQDMPQSSLTVSKTASRWDDPYTREGMRVPGPELGAGFVVHEVGVFVLDEAWNYEAVRSPFWRLYHNSAPGAALRVGRRRLELTPELAWLVPAGVTFDCVGRPGPRHLWIHFSPGVGAGRDWIEPRGVGLTPPLKALVGWLRRTLAEPTPDAWTTGQVGQALLHAVFATCGPETRGETEPRLRTLLLEIERRLAAPPEVREMAALVHLSESRFARWFREQRGESPAAYVRQRRVAEACRRLAFTEDSVDQVADGLGFANRFHFSRVFKAVLGETPGTFKRRRGPR